MVDILSGVLTGSSHAGEVKDPFDDFSGPQNVGHLFITFKSNLFVKNFNNRIQHNIKKIKNFQRLRELRKSCILDKISMREIKLTVKKELKFQIKLNLKLKIFWIRLI